MSAEPAPAARDRHATPRQALLLAPGRLELREVPRPHPGPGEVVLKITCALSCGTDLKAFRRGHPMWPMPTPFGHEFTGIIAEVGADVSDFREGDAVMAAPTAPCGRCFFCARGQENLCPQAMARMVLGAYADYLLVGAHVVARNMFHKPASLAIEQAALLEPLSCVVHAHEMARPEPGENVLIVGAGAFGLLHALVLKARGVSDIAIVGRGANRLRWASELDGVRTLDARADGIDEAIAALNQGHGPDLVIESTGQVDGWADAFRRVRRGGRVLFFGGCPPDTTLGVDTRRMHYDNLALLSPFHFRPRDVRSAYELLASGRLEAGRLVNARRPLAELPEVFAMLGRGEALKCAVIP
ncbi:MAG TPA: alcohol dehydrogenase catalytic domain-containing protein [Candidatus Binataceae bacterium]|nr:alcohol dehydrogenase catalytic domain-containing protein [Candidatus Binataceae bacterium]